MIIASVNMNKRMGNEQSLRCLQSWLNKQDVDVVCFQEPWARNKRAIIPLQSYVPVGGNDSVFAFSRDGIVPPKVELLSHFAQRLTIDYLEVFNVYLSAYSSNERVAQLNNLCDFLSVADRTAKVVVGDFNLAPSELDGLSGSRYSDFTKPRERRTLEDVLGKSKLIDVMRPDPGNPTEFTIERMIGDSKVSFRCDLILLSDFLTVDSRYRYDSTTRLGENRFTDHSAVLLHIPLTPKQTKRSLSVQLNLLEENSERKGSTECERTNDYDPEKTAMSRTTGSLIARRLVELGALKNLAVSTILDFGCGRGADVKYYQDQGLKASGFDPYEPFGWHQMPECRFDLVTVVFVLNVLSTYIERLVAIEAAAAKVRNGGYLAIACRSPEAIDREAAAKRWPKFNDGYWSSSTRKTFQKGISNREITYYLDRVGFVQSIDSTSMKFGRDVTFVLASEKR